MRGFVIPVREKTGGRVFDVRIGLLTANSQSINTSAPKLHEHLKYVIDTYHEIKSTEIDITVVNDIAQLERDDFGDIMNRTGGTMGPLTNRPGSPTCSRRVRDTVL